MSLLIFASWLGCAEPQTQDSVSCVDQPLLTWENFGEGFLRSYCQSCHASDAPNRYGAPTALSFDTQAQAQEHAQRILARSVGPEADMPPGGGVTAPDQERLEIWIQCGL